MSIIFFFILLADNTKTDDYKNFIREMTIKGRLADKDLVFLLDHMIATGAIITPILRELTY